MKCQERRKSDAFYEQLKRVLMNHTIEMLLNTLKEQISSSTTDLNFILLHPSEGIFCCDDRVVEVILNGSLFSHSFYLFPRQKPLQIQPICGPYKYLLLTMALKHTIAQTVFTNSLLIYPNGEQQQIKEFYWRRKNSPFSMEYEQRIEQNPPELTYQCTIMDYKSTIELVTIDHHQQKSVFHYGVVRLEETLLEAFHPGTKHPIILDLSTKNKLPGELSVRNQHTNLLELGLELQNGVVVQLPFTNTYQKNIHSSIFKLETPDNSSLTLNYHADKRHILELLKSLKVYTLHGNCLKLSFQSQFRRDLCVFHMLAFLGYEFEGLDLTKFEMKKEKPQHSLESELNGLFSSEKEPISPITPQVGRQVTNDFIDILYTPKPTQYGAFTVPEDKKRPNPAPPASNYLTVNYAANLGKDQPHNHPPNHPNPMIKDKHKGQNLPWKKNDSDINEKYMKLLERNRTLQEENKLLKQKNKELKSKLDQYKHKQPTLHKEVPEFIKLMEIKKALQGINGLAKPEQPSTSTTATATKFGHERSLTYKTLTFGKNQQSHGEQSYSKTNKSHSNQKNDKIKSLSYFRKIQPKVRPQKLSFAQ